MTFRPIPVGWTQEIKSLARIIFGFLLFRYGMEQVLGFPPAWVDAPTMSLFGLLKILSFPGGILIMLGLFNRPVTLVLSVAHFAYWLIEPFRGFLLGEIGLHGRGGLFGGGGAPSDPLLLPAFFLLYLFLTGPGVWSLDRLLKRDPGEPFDVRWVAYALGALRIATGLMFFFHGLPKLIGWDPTTLRALASVLEVGVGPIFVLGLFTRPLAFLLSGEMAFAYFINHWPERFWGSFVEPNQMAAIMNCFLFLFLWAAGPGAPSLDGLRKRGGARPRR